MWVLIMVMYVAGEVWRDTPLNIFETIQDCLAQRAYVQHEMEAAYPGDVDYTLRCEAWVEPAVAPETVPLQQLTGRTNGTPSTL